MEVQPLMCDKSATRASYTNEVNAVFNANSTSFRGHSDTDSTLSWSEGHIARWRESVVIYLLLPCHPLTFLLFCLSDLT